MVQIKNTKKAVALVISALIIFTLVHAGDKLVYDMAGTGEMGFKDGTALKATFTLPYGLALDVDGGIIVVDSYSNRIRKLKDGEAATIAGFTDSKDLYGFTRGGFRDGKTDEARFNNPRDAVVDSKGNIFISDTGNHVIRKISEGKVYTFAGTGNAGYKNGKASTAEFNTPTGLAIDKDDNIYIADTLNNVIRKITPDGTVSNLAGVKTSVGKLRNGRSSLAYFNEPGDVAVDADGNIYVLDTGNQVIRKISAGRVITFSGSIQPKLEGTDYLEGGFEDGRSAAARYNFPKGMSITAEGLIFVADTYNNAIRVVKPNGEVLTIAGTGTAGRQNGKPEDSMFNCPTSVLYSEGSLYIADMYNNLVRKMEIDIDDVLGVNDPLSGIELKSTNAPVQLWIDKNRLDFEAYKPYISPQGKTMVPLDYMCSSIGAKVKSYDAAAGSITISKDNKDYMIVDQSGVSIENEVLYVHIRPFAYCFGYDVLWVQDYKAVILTKADSFK